MGNGTVAMQSEELPHNRASQSARPPRSGRTFVIRKTLGSPDCSNSSGSWKTESWRCSSRNSQSPALGIPRSGRLCVARIASTDGRTVRYVYQMIVELEQIGEAGQLCAVALDLPEDAAEAGLMVERLA